MWVSLPLRLARIPFLWSGGGGGDGLMRDPLVAMHEWRWMLVPQRQGEVLFLIPRGVIQPRCLDSWGHVFSIYRHGSWQADSPAVFLVAWDTRPVVRPGS